ncbi:MAG: D-alanyl-D-alanine carboxypeptidase family protein, partial [Alphaproteobacteria bacterium]|nr:D-alanyl-D-alanine carboxypeptidase family protein [Alphaproteobacteria bacterium]
MPIFQNFKTSLIAFLVVIAGGLTLSGAAKSQDLETSAKQVFLLDMSTNTVLFEKDADSRMYPASMTKMMTAYMLLEQVKNGALSLDDTFPVSQKAWKKGGSKMFVEVGKRVRIEDLLRGIIIQSGNDATIVVAEGLAGSEDAFARAMTDKAKELGMLNSQFKNASGWPDPEHYTTARDLAILAEATIRNLGEYYHIYSEEYFTFSGIKQRNRNPLIRNGYNGADGLKTGHTEASGYGLTASAMRDGRRLVLVANGMNSSNERGVEAERIMTWGFREWKHYDLYKAAETVVKVP